MLKHARRALRRASDVVLIAGLGSMLVVPSTVSWGATPIESFRYSPDITVSLGTVPQVTDDDVVLFDGSSFVLVFAGALPEDVDAFHRFPSGDRLLSFDTPVELPGAIFASPGDVVMFDGSSFSLVFEVSGRGLPDGINVDAVTVDAAGRLLLSFDTTVDLGSFVATDEDVVRVEPSGFALSFDGSAAGVPAELDVDAVHKLTGNDRWLVSFDVTGTVGGVLSDDEDLLEYDPASGSWELALDGSVSFGGGAVSGDMDAVHAKAVDDDGDGFGFDDCDDFDPIVWAVPGEVTDLLLSHSGGVGGTTTLNWSPPAALGGVAVVYDTLASLTPNNFIGGTECVESDDGSDTSAQNNSVLGLGKVAHFLTRSGNTCGDGTLGFARGSGLGERSGRSCP